MKPSEQERALAALLRSGRADPSGDELQRLERRLAPWLGAMPAAAHGGGAGGATWKAVVFLAALGLFSPSDVMRPQAPPARAPITSPGAATHANEAREALSAPSGQASVSVSDLPDAPAPTSARGAIAAPRTLAPRAAIAEVAAEPAETADSAPRQDQAAESEASFLRRAQQTLGGDPAAALQLLEEHPARYPQGILVQEREVMLIDALSRLGRIDEARARAGAFAVRYPHSAHESRIASILKGGAR